MKFFKFKTEIHAILEDHSYGSWLHKTLPYIQPELYIYKYLDRIFVALLQDYFSFNKSFRQYFPYNKLYLYASFI